MTSELYDWLGVDRAASSARIRSAYGQAVSKLARRRRALVEQGGDTAQIDLQRTRLDQAWEILSDPLRRRRYDAMLQWTDARREPDAEALWDGVSDALVHPAAAVGAKLLRVTAKLTEIGQLPLAPSGAAEEPPTLVPHDDDLTQPRAAVLGAGAPSTEPTETTATARLTQASPEPATPRAPSPPPPPERSAPQVPEISAEELASLVDAHGYSGALLKAVRELRHVTLQDMADHTRISVRYLEAIEQESWDALPSATFVRGYVREMARMLGLDDGEVVAGYMRRSTG